MLQYFCCCWYFCLLPFNFEVLVMLFLVSCFALCVSFQFFSCFAYLSGKYDFWLIVGWRLGETNTRVRLDSETLERERMMYLNFVCVCVCSHIWGLLVGRRTMQIIFIRAFDMKRPQAINCFIVGFISFDFTCQTVSFQIPDLKIPIECTIEKCSWSQTDQFKRWLQAALMIHLWHFVCWLRHTESVAI